MQELRLLYSNPAEHKPPTERCEVTARSRPAPSRVACSILVGLRYRPDYRGVGLVSLLPRLAHACLCEVGHQLHHHPDGRTLQHQEGRVS
jgi:hypothetical protein